MAEPKTRPTAVRPAEFLAAIPDETKRRDAEWLMQMMTRVTGKPPVLWGAAIVGFGEFRCLGSNGKETPWPLLGFSLRKRNLTVYLAPAFEGREAALAKLGPHSTGLSCLYLKRLADVDREVLTSLARGSVDDTMARTRGLTEAIRPHTLKTPIGRTRTATQRAKRGTRRISEGLRDSGDT